MILTRKSVRTFDGTPLRKEDMQDLLSFMENIPNPWGIPVRFVYLDCEKHGLSSPVIRGEGAYVAAMVPEVEHCEEAYGYSFEKFVLHAWSMGIGTTWIAGTMKREKFEKAAGKKDGEMMIAVTPIGYPAPRRSTVEKILRQSVKGDERKAPSELFFEGDFSSPLADAPALELLEVVRWAPSAANKQPCRVVKVGGKYHFFCCHTQGKRGSSPWDIQMVDVGIAICNLMEVTEGSVSFEDPEVAAPEDTEYVATVSVKR